MSNDKTLSDYMKMINSVEEEDPKESSEEQDIQESEKGCACGCGDECTCSPDCEDCGCNTEESIDEALDVKSQDLNNTWTESSTFMEYVKSNIDVLHQTMESGLTEVINDGDEYRCNEFLIVGVTLEQGLMVVVRCENEYEDTFNAHVEIKDGSARFVEFI